LTPLASLPDGVGQPRIFRIGPWTIPETAGVFSISLVASLLFFLVGPYSNFAAPGYLDPWIYTGIFTHFSYVIEHYSYTYYVARLPWILPGALVFKVASPEAASVILNALIMASSATALYLIVEWHYGKLPAVLSCIALMTNPYFVTAVSWDYPDGPAIAYAFMALACFLRPSRGRVPKAVLGGACLAFSGYTNLAGLPVLVGIGAIPLWRYRSDWRQWLRQGFYVFLGASAVTLALTLLGKIYLNTFEFFRPQIQMILYTRDHPNYLANMWGTGNAWIPGAYRLSPALVVLVLGAAILIQRSRLKRPTSPAFVESYICLVVTCALFCLFEFQFHNVGLRVFYLSSYMISSLLVFAGLFIGEVLSPLAEKDSRNIWGIWAGVALFGAALPFVLARPHPVSFSSGRIWTLILTVALATLICVVGFQRRRIVPSAAACCLVFVALFFGPAYDQSLSYIWVKSNRPVFETLMQLESAVDSALDFHRTARFWFDLDEPDVSLPNGVRMRPDYLFDSAYGLYVGGYVDFTSHLKSAPAADIRSFIDARTTFVHVTFDSDKTLERTQLLTLRGVTVGNERHSTIPTKFGKLQVVLQDVLDDSHLH
jgi:hypothetical protein